MSLQQIIGARLRTLRESKGMSATQAAQATGVNRMQIYNYEHGKYHPRLDLLQKILRAYDYSLSKFFAKWENGEPV